MRKLWITGRHMRLLTAHQKAGHHVRESITHDTMLERVSAWQVYTDYTTEPQAQTQRVENLNQVRTGELLPTLDQRRSSRLLRVEIFLLPPTFFAQNIFFLLMLGEVIEQTSELWVVASDSVAVHLTLAAANPLKWTSRKRGSGALPFIRKTNC